MIEYSNKNIFELKVDAIVNPCNCVGVAGAGLSEQFKNRFPKNYEQYVTNCKQGYIAIGKPFFHQNFDSEFPKYIINLPTKNHYKYKSEYDFVKKGLVGVYKNLSGYDDIITIAFPALGCGLGGLEWKEVLKFLKAFDKMCENSQKFYVNYLIPPKGK